MCGITGAIWLAGSRSIEDAEFTRMNNALAHRGPDGHGIYRDGFDNGGGVLLGHRRLSIIDLHGGKQPMSNEDETVWITFNGEIYNYRELRQQLESQGHRFRTHSDTETIVHLYEQHGENFVDHLRGMFAIAIWDRERRRAILARDRLGQKPLVYHQDEQRLLFASELKAILALPDVPRQVRPQAIDEYLMYGYIPHPGTIYQQIHKLPPAHIAVFEEGRLSTRCYWQVPATPEMDASYEDLCAELRQEINESVRLRMRSDVPLGAFLSGGIDSTIITGVMQENATQATNTFTISFPVDGFDESEYAETASRHLKTNHRVMQVQPDSLSLLEELVELFDEPFADSSAVPTYYLAKLTREHVTVALTGDGGDELFAGYGRYRTIDRLRHFDRMPTPLAGRLAGAGARLIPAGPQSSTRQRLKNRLGILQEPFERRYINWVTQFSASKRQAMYRPDFMSQLDEGLPSEFLQGLLHSTQGGRAGLRAMRCDMHSYLPCDLLAKVDITSMAHGLECRSPFLDHRVVEVASKFPYSMLDRPGLIKPAISQTFAKHLPPALRDRPKMGFSVPLDNWFRGDLHELAQDTLTSDDGFCQQFIEPTYINRMLQEHQSGRYHHGDRIWSLLFLELWGREFG
ncbi:asparagine synthase (glutamine-hydrolyzing) [Allorhodopirellula solitaria]|uniref:asparagine synthase (glutamine-hydrolyzing) n=1 Tax=Allorhodopirellula solitaria TaxID=2527987 RepID=A0A5C5WP43_9BACT|nr:asparagine synthase (glutamine-hydrolyzing) [Allorhodopirellula solitaria]TWT51909.1 Asparagine synthetase [glutamine-hydrolyzing] 1 [Allorhodopirellula solitaria]